MNKTAIDWSQPIEYFDGVDIFPAVYIGSAFADGETEYVVRRRGCYAGYDLYGYYKGNMKSNTKPHIRNVPPPKKECTMHLHLYNDGSCSLRNYYSGPGYANTLACKKITIKEGEFE